MKQKVFCIYDDKAKAYLAPFFLPEMGMAIRAFGDCVNDPKHAFGMHPEDYTLFCAGTFDQASGLFELEGTLLVVAHGVEMRKRIEDIAEVKLNGAKPGSLPASAHVAHD